MSPLLTLCHISLSHLHARLAQIPVPLVPSSSSTSSSSAHPSHIVLIVAVQLLTRPFAVALVQHHEHAHHPGRHRAGREDDETDGDEEEVVPVAQALVAVCPQLHADLRQPLARQLWGIVANCLALIWR